MSGAGVYTCRLFPLGLPMDAEITLEYSFSFCIDSHHAKGTGLYAHFTPDALVIVYDHRGTLAFPMARTGGAGESACSFLTVIARNRNGTVLERFYVNTVAGFLSVHNK
jgi:hypothetical protein